MLIRSFSRSSSECLDQVQGHGKIRNTPSALAPLLDPLEERSEGLAKLDALRQLFTTRPWLLPAVAPP